MERLIQLLDDLDDLIGVVGLFGERVRRLIVAFALGCITLCIQIGGILLALRHPPLALAAAILMFVTLLYRSVTTFDHGIHPAAPGGDSNSP